MAEILLSLTIIGVVAAITLPSLTGNINERTWNTQRKALYARFSQAIALMPALNGYGTLKEETDSAGSTSIEDTAAETFVTAGLAKVMKINNICDYEHLEDCGITAKLSTLHGSTISMPQKMSELNSTMLSFSGTLGGSLGGFYDVSHSQLDTKAAAFETQNGESIIVYYNPTCTGSLNEVTFTADSVGNGMYIQQRICANFIYDLNGNKGPNTVGKDIGFMTAMYPFDVQLYAPYPAVRPLSSKYAAMPASGTSASKACTEYDSEYRIPRADELASMFVNSKLIDAANYEADTYGYVSSDFWTSNILTSKRVMSQNLTTGFRDDMGVDWNGMVWCVKR